MSQSTAVKELPETSIWYGATSEEDVQLVRRRHAEKVEEWLDFADFATELFALHEKYGIEKGEEGYFAYRKHLRTSYYEKLQTYGPTPDPLDEGCDCIFCRMHSKDEPAEEATGAIRDAKQPDDESRLGQVPTEPITRRVRCADQRNQKNQRGDGPHSGPYRSNEPPVVNQEPAELGPHNGPHATTEYVSQIKRRLGKVPAEPLTPAAKPITRRVRCADRRNQKIQRGNGPHSGPYGSNKSVAGETVSLKKMAGAVF